MPAFSKLKIAALDDLSRQLRFAPPETLRKQMERAIKLSAEIDPAVMYPEDWVVYRITGYRKDVGGNASFTGAALLGDVSGLVERLSAAAGVTEKDLAGEHLGIKALCARWKVSRKTLERWRRQGLVAVRVMGANGRPTLLFSRAAVERFEKLRGDQVAAAAGYTRMGPDVEEQIERRGKLYARAGLSLNQAAARLARRYGRSREAVRRALLREGGAKTFGRRGPPNARERELIARAHWWGIDPRDVARRLGRAAAAVRRIANEDRAARLRLIAAELDGSATKRDIDAALKPETVRSGLGEPGATDLLSLIRGARAGGAPIGVVERDQARAYRALVSRAAAGIGRLNAHSPSAVTLDRIETDLRWAARLRAELVRAQLPLVVRTLEGSLGRPLEEIRPTLLAPLMLDAIAAVSEAVHTFDPGKGGRLAAAAGLALSRIGARFVKEHGAEIAELPGRARATSRVSEGITVEDWTLRLAPWQRHGGRVWLECGVRASLAKLSADDANLLRARYGWGPMPLTLREAAAMLGISPVAAARRERAALKAARA